ncbi:hypothetical protein RRG08_034557 [Elysia crispata]|uniref:Uncharacterized protein n=1 Tax=Elysia crispata TaxID=231223 RepID=A0AAE1B313_9GAST|nr:hypothetical protein RRG08_034557 [Elysia crispata]
MRSIAKFGLIIGIPWSVSLSVPYLSSPRLIAQLSTLPPQSSKQQCDSRTGTRAVAAPPAAARYSWWLVFLFHVHDVVRG